MCETIIMGQRFFLFFITQDLNNSVFILFILSSNYSVFTFFLLSDLQLLKLVSQYAVHWQDFYSLILLGVWSSNFNDKNKKNNE